MSFSDREPRARGRGGWTPSRSRLPRACTVTPGKVTHVGPAYGSHARRGTGKGPRVAWASRARRGGASCGHCYSVEVPQAPPARHALHRSVHVVGIVSLPPYVLHSRPPVGSRAPRRGASAPRGASAVTSSTSTCPCGRVCVDSVSCCCGGVAGGNGGVVETTASWLGGAAGGDATNCCGGCPHGDGGVTNGDGGDRPEKNACETAGEWAPGGAPPDHTRRDQVTDRV